MSNKRNIQSFGKTLAYLKDPLLRRKEAGDALLTVDGAQIGGERFEGQAWQNIRFVNCDFQGAYEVKLASMENCSFDGCRFAGIFAWGVQSNVRFTKCTIAGSSHLWGAEGSKAVVYERCALVGTSAERNNWGSVGTYGEAAFTECTGKWFGVLGHSALLIKGCEFDSMDCKIDPRESKGVVPGVLISDSKLAGKFDMVSSSFKSLTIRDTVLENLDLSGATVKGDVVMERVRGGALFVGIKEGAGGFTLKDSQIYGNGQSICTIYAGAFKTVLVENNVFGGGVGKRAVIGGGFEPGDTSPQPVLTRSMVLRNNKIPSLRSGRLNAASVLLAGNTIDSLELQQSRIGKLELTGNTIARSVDFSNTQVKESKVQSLAKGQAKLDGSNVKVN